MKDLIFWLAVLIVLLLLAWNQLQLIGLHREQALQNGILTKSIKADQMQNQWIKNHTKTLGMERARQKVSQRVDK